MWRSKKCSICISKNYCEELCAYTKISADRRTICRYKNYLQLELFDQKNWRTIYISKKYQKIQEIRVEKVFHLQIKELLLNWETCCRWKSFVQMKEIFHLQIKDLSRDWRIICIPNHNLQIEEKCTDRVIQSAGWRTTYISTNCMQIKKHLPVKQVFHLQVEKLTANWGVIYKSKKYSTAYQRNICRLRNCLEFKELRADWSLVCRLMKYSIYRLKTYLQIKEL